MTEKDTPDLTDFRRDVRDFIDRVADDEIREAGRKTTSFFPPFEPTMRWHRLLHAQGWSAPAWPLEYGGPGWPVAQQKAFEEECRAAQMPPLLPQALSMVGPAIMRFGTDAQKAAHLPGILSGENFWTQGYSEPNAGSDLASLSCRAERRGDQYVINGSKTWTTYAHHADRMFLLVRTQPGGKPQQGISFFLLDDLDRPGLTIRPIIGLDGLPEQCDVFFDDVEVPLDSCLGEENDGWSVAKYLLEHERGGSSSFAAHFRQELAFIRRIAAETGDGFGGALGDDPVFQQRFSQLALEVAMVDATEVKFAALDKGSPESGPMSSMIKITAMETLQRINELAIDTVGTPALTLQIDALMVGSETPPMGSPDTLTAMPKYLNNRAATIFGGSSEIQRNIIAKTLLAP
ncbi:acyl-CoA dehydrogenase, middle domain-containing protein [Salinisphaera dokdonensis CL-ES53]|uniref:Acyl-CoA dehydrogenase, middle domain-containing protein n=1 Tax=Salinisphaera dokdonensis CL-ES53 TaxID=1304272 RepID=A0ABV2AYV7_9GAMM